MSARTVISITGKILAAVLFSLALWEVVLRVLVVRPVVYEQSPELGLMPRPNSSALSTIEGRGVLQFNELGLRNPPIAPKAPGETRIVAFGDSFTDAYQMPVEKTYPLRLQALLQETPVLPAKVSVINAGRRGSSPVYFIDLAPSYTKILQPDWIVMQLSDTDWMGLFAHNDLAKIWLEAQGRNFIIQREAREPRQSRLRRLQTSLGLNHLALIQPKLGRNARPEITQRNQSSPRDAKTVRPLVARGMDWTLRSLQARYPRLVLIHIPQPLQINATLKDQTPLEALLIQRCRDLGIPLIPMRGPILEDYARAQQPPYGFANTLPWYGHINTHGHSIIARELQRFFMRPKTLRSFQSTPENRRTFTPHARHDFQHPPAKHGAS